jgi:ABC-type nitrate/sulfonate/bicarbonate transport system permease component
VIPIIAFALSAVRNVRHSPITTGRALNPTSPRRVRPIPFPAARPEILTVLRAGFPLALIGTLLAGMLASQRGPDDLLTTGIRP